MRLDEGIGVNGYKQVGLDATRFFNPPAKGDEVVAVACQHRAHVRFGIDHRLEFSGDGEGDVFLIAAVMTAGTRILATVSGVYDNGDKTCDTRPFAILALGLAVSRFVLRHGGRWRRGGQGCGISFPSLGRVGFSGCPGCL